MNRTVLALVCIGMTACAPLSGKPDARLEGVWVSNRERTLANLAPASLPDEHLRWLRKNLGQFAYCFRGGQAAAFTLGARAGEIQPMKYWVTESTSTSVTLSTSTGITRTLHLRDGCFHHAVPGWGYEEYFCRRADGENPCGS